jgi:hypothetical protein
MDTVTDWVLRDVQLEFTLAFWAAGSTCSAWLCLRQTALPRACGDLQYQPARGRTLSRSAQGNSMLTWLLLVALWLALTARWSTTRRSLAGIAIHALCRDRSIESGFA